MTKFLAGGPQLPEEANVRKGAVRTSQSDSADTHQGPNELSHIGSANRFVCTQPPLTEAAREHGPLRVPAWF